MTSEGSDGNFYFTDGNEVDQRFANSKDIVEFIKAEGRFWREKLDPISKTDEFAKLSEWIASGHLLLRKFDPFKTKNARYKPRETKELFRQLMTEYETGRLPWRHSELAKGISRCIETTTTADTLNPNLRSWLRNNMMEPMENDELRARTSSLTARTLRTQTTASAPNNHKPSTTAARTKQPMKPLLSAGNTMTPREFNENDTNPVQGNAEEDGLPAPAFMKDIKEANETLSSLQKALTNARDMHNDLARVEDLTKQLTALETKYKELVGRIEGAADKAAKQAAETYTAQRILEDPAEYWSQKETSHTTGTEDTLKLFYILCAVAAVALPAVTAIFFLLFKIIPLEPWTGFFAFIGAPALLGVWVIRIVSRNYAANLALKTDAAERVTMMKVYLSLTAQGNLTEEDKHLMIRALFRPANTTISEEPMPGWLDTIIERAGKPG